jgi:hypothetical protein
VVFREPDTPGNGPSIYRHTVTAYRTADAASAYLSSVRAAVHDCPTRRLTDETDQYTIDSSSAQRIELSVTRVSGAGTEGAPPQSTFRVSIVRSGVRVSVFTDVGWEGCPTSAHLVDALIKAAADQL